MQPPGGSGGFLSGRASVPVAPLGEGAFSWAFSPSQSALLCSRDGLHIRAGPHLSPGLGTLERDTDCTPARDGHVLPFVSLAPMPPFQSFLSSFILDVSAFGSPRFREGVRALKMFTLPLLGIPPKEIV